MYKKKSVLFLSLLLSIAMTAFFLGFNPAEKAYASISSAYYGIVRCDDADFKVTADAEVPEIRDYFQMKYANRNVKLDEGKKGVLISSKASGSAVNGKSFMLGGIYDGEFSIDFRVLSELTFQEPNDESTGWWARGNDYADVRTLTFTFTDIDTQNYFKVNIDATTKYSASTPTMSVTLMDGTTRAHSYGDEAYDVRESDNGVQVNSEYYTRLDGTGFSNTGSKVNTYVFTSGAKSTSFRFDPENMCVFADRYNRDGSIGEGKYQAYPRYENQYFDGRNCVLRTDNLLVLDLDDPSEVGAANALGGFGRYTVEVCFEKMTDNTTVVKNDGAETSYERFANMFIYNLCGKDLNGKQTDTEAPFVYGKLSNAFSGSEYRFSPIVFDNFDGAMDFNGTIELEYPDGRVQRLPGNTFVPTVKGRYTVRFIGAKDKAGNVAKTYETTLDVDAFYYSFDLSPYVLFESNVKVPTAALKINGSEITAETKCYAPSGDEVVLSDKNTFFADEKGRYTIKYSCAYGEKKIDDVLYVVAVYDSESMLGFSAEELAAEKDFSVKTTEYGSDKVVAIDDEKKGILLESVKSGIAAEGAKFDFKDAFDGDFSIDFRVYSGETFRGAFDAGKNGTAFSDEVNPYLDLKEITLVFTDIATGKQFFVIVSGSHPNHNSTPVARVLVGGMGAPSGLEYESENGILTTVGKSETGTLLSGTSFSNVSEIDGEVLNGYYNEIYFERPTMKVFASVYTKTYSGGVWNGGYAKKKALVADLSNAAHVGAENALKTFGSYSVSVVFSDVTDNAVQTEIGKYPRKARAVIYTVNGQKLTEENGLIENAVGPRIFTEGEYLVKGKEGRILLSSFDLLDGKQPYNGEVFYRFFDETEEKSAYCENGELFITAERAGQLIVRASACRDFGGVYGEDYTFVARVTESDIFSVKEYENDVYDLNDGALEVTASDITLDDETEELVFAYVKVEGESDGFVIGKTGVYNVVYYAKCASGKMFYLRKTLTVVDKTAPVISGESKVVRPKKGETVDIEMPSATDAVDGSTEVDFALYKDGVKICRKDELVAAGMIYKFEESGNYALVYTARDKSGNVSSREIYYLVSSEKDGGNSAWIVIIVICAVGAIASATVVALKKSKKSQGDKNEKNR